MFDLGFAELLVIGIVALIVVGPKDLPVLFRNVGRYVGRLRGMAREFSSAMNQAADEAGVSEIKKGLDVATDPMRAAADNLRDATSGLTNLDPASETGKLAAKRSEETAKRQAASARATAERKAREAQEALDKADAAEAALKPDAPKGDG